MCLSGTAEDQALPEPDLNAPYFTGSFVADPLSDAAQAQGQHVANETRRRVRASYPCRGAEGGGRHVPADAGDRPAGRRWHWCSTAPSRCPRNSTGWRRRSAGTTARARRRRRYGPGRCAWYGR
ncbi:hypothetical protein NKH77_28935 [Streptomyces sp. M19]